MAGLTGSVPEPFPAAVYNQPPGVSVPAFLGEQGWGSPVWGMEVSVGPSRKRLVINARSETVAEKPLFREALAHRRCVLPASGFFEWQRGDGGSTPYYFRPQSDPGILLAGLILEGGTHGDSHVVVLTRSADEWMGEIHHRAPVLIRSELLLQWLAGGHSQDLLTECSFGSEKEALNRHPVSERVNRVAENDPDILTPVSPPDPLTQGELFS